MLHLNVRISIKTSNPFKKLLTAIKFEFKVICLTETCCTDDLRNETLFNSEDYTSINRVRKNGRGGGICAFIHNSLTFKLKSDLGTNNNDIKSLAIEIINKKCKNVVISAHYKQPAVGVILIFLRVKVLQTDSPTEHIDKLTFRVDCPTKLTLTVFSPANRWSYSPVGLSIRWWRPVYCKSYFK